MLRVSSWTSALSTVRQDTIPHEDIDMDDATETEIGFNGNDDEDEDEDEKVEKKKIEMVCKIAASADGKITQIKSSSSGPDGNVLMDKIDSIYQAKNHKHLKTLPYMNMNSLTTTTTTTARDINMESSSDEEDEKIIANEMEQRRKSYDANDEENLVQTLKSSLLNSGFQLVSQRDLDLCNALNDGYLLRLSIEPDVKGFDPIIGREFYGKSGKGTDSGEDTRHDDDETGAGVGASDINDDDDDMNIQQLLLDGRILIFRRGYSSEITRGRLIPPKLDYLQSSIVQRSAARLARRIAKIDAFIDDKLTSTVQSINGNIRDAIKLNGNTALSRIRVDKGDEGDEFGTKKMKIDSDDDDDDGKTKATGVVNDAIVEKLQPLADKLTDKGVDILKNATTVADAAINSTTAALVENIKENADKRKKKFKLGRYAGRTTAKNIEITDVPTEESDSIRPSATIDVSSSSSSSSSASTLTSSSSKEASFTFAGVSAPGANSATMDINDALAPFMVCEDRGTGSGVGTTATTIPNTDTSMNLLERVSIANLVDLFSTGGRRRLIKSMFSVSELVEPTYEEVVLVWRRLPDKAEETKNKKRKSIPIPKWVYDTAEIFDIVDRLPEKPKPPPEPVPLPLEIRTFDRVPMANLLAVLPKTKLIFRPADALIFDLVNAFSLLAVLASQKFDSPKLDIIALVSVCLWVLRTFFRYSNKLARYDLLVNKFLTSRISHRDAGALRYIASEAGVQRSKRASLVHEWLVMDYLKDLSNGDNDYAFNQEGDKLNMKLKSMPTREELIKIGSIEVNKLLDGENPVLIDIDAALDDLVGLDLIQFHDDGNDDDKSGHQLVRILTGKEADDALATLWNQVFYK